MKDRIEIVLLIIVVLPPLYANICPDGRTPKLTKFGRQVRIDEKKNRNGRKFDERNASFCVGLF